MTQRVSTAAPGYAAFISYAREDEAFARRLETEIEAYGSIAGRVAKVFRDRSDFTGSEYGRALEGHLRDAESLIVLCSPIARQSTFVADEIRRFAALHGADRIFPVILSGLPDNEADDQKAFPPALLEVTRGIPLAADYRSFDAGRQRPSGSQFEAEWYKLLGNVLGVTPDVVREQDVRQRVRALRRRIVASAVALAAIGVLAVVLFALYQRALRAEARASEMSAKAESALAQLARARAGGWEIAEEAPVPPPPPPRAPEPAAPAAPMPAEPEPSPVAPEPPAPQPGGAVSRVYVHIRDESQRSAADLLARAMATQQVVVPGVQRLDVGPGTSELRYFRTSDEAEAKRIAAAMRAQGVTVELRKVPGYETSAKVAPRTFELWMAPGAP